MLKALEPTIDNVPRHAMLLLQLRTDQRIKLFEELCKKAEKELEPGLPAFAGMKDHEQAECLVRLLSDYDRSSSGYITVGVALPLRSAKQPTNEKRWQEFAEKIEVAINDVLENGYQGLQVIRFEDHGVIILGFKPPPSAMVGSMMPVVMPPQGPPTSNEGQEAGSCHQLVRDLILKGKGRVLSSSTVEEKKDEVRKIVKESTAGVSAEDISSVVCVLDRQVELHLKQGGCGGKDCELLEYCQILREVLIEQRTLQLC